MKRVLEVLAGIGAIALMIAFTVGLMVYASIKDGDIREQRIAPYREQHIETMRGN